MFGSIGAPELILIFIVALLIFGPRKLPELGRALGRGISEFRRATTDLKVTLEREIAEDEGAGSTTPLPAQAPAASESGSEPTPTSGQDGASHPA